MSSTDLLKMICFCTKTLNSSDIVWLGLSESFYFALLIFDNLWSFWKLLYCDWKKSSIRETNNKQSWKLFNVFFWLKPNMLNNIYRKLWIFSAARFLYICIKRAGIYLLNVNNKNTRTMCEIRSNLPIKTCCLYC